MSFMTPKGSVAVLLLVCWARVGHASPTLVVKARHSKAATKPKNAWAASQIPIAYREVHHGAEAVDAHHLLRVGKIPGVAQLALGVNFGCALTRTGRVWCWGKNRSAQLGRGSIDKSRLNAPILFAKRPVARLRAKRLVPLLAGMCAAVGKRWLCWGYDDRHRLGGGAALPGVATLPLSRPTHIRAFDGYTDLAFHPPWACGVKRGQVLCWGQFKYETPPRVMRPRRVEALETRAPITLGARYGVTNVEGKGVMVWGSLGPICPRCSAKGRFLAYQLRGLQGQQFAVLDHSLTVLSKGTLRCEGVSTDCRGGRGVKEVVELRQGSQFACARTRDRRVACWGYNGDKQLSDPEHGMDQPVWVPITQVVELSLSSSAACARRQDNQVLCWGDGFGHQPVRVFPRSKRLFAGPYQICALSLRGELLCASSMLDGTSFEPDYVPPR